MVRHKNSYGRWENLDRLPVRDCSCDKCERARSQQGWTPRGSQSPDVGVVADTDHVVSFKTKNDQDRTIIADGDFSDDNKGFRRRHNDYGEKREAPGEYFDVDRGHYTGPDH
jgi:hypothetical protein